MSSTEKFPLEPHKLAVVLVFLIVSALSNWIALAYIHDHIGRDPLPDIVFSMIEEQPWATPVGDFMVTLSSMSIILLFAFHKYRVVVIRRVLYIVGCLMLVTQLPSGYQNNAMRCREALPEINRTLFVYFKRTMEQTVHVGFQDNTNAMLCGDLLFSGHTLIMVISALSIQKYIDRSFHYLKWLPFSFAAVGIPCMVISRTHYTCDVLIAFLASKAVFALYHAFCEIESSHGRRRSMLRTFFFMRMAAWLEANVNNQKLKNEFEFPFRDALERLIGEEGRNGGDKSMSNSSSTAAMESV